MRCKNIQYKLSEYVDGLLDQNQKQKVEEHLLRCQGCRKKFDELKNYTTIINNLDRQKAPGDIEANVLRALEQKPAGKEISVRTIPIWAKTIAVAAVILAFVYLVIPESYFQPGRIYTQYLPVEAKRSKGPESEMTKYKKMDLRIYQIGELVEMYDGKISEIMRDNNSSLIDGIIVELPKKKYRDFAGQYNQSGILHPLPVSAPFTLSRKIDIILYFDCKGYLVDDYNMDGFDDIIMSHLSGNKKGQTFIALNDSTGNFKQPMSYHLADSIDLITVGGNRFTGDFNGDGLGDIFFKNTSIDSAGWYVSINKGHGDYKERTNIRFEPHASGYLHDFLIFTGDFNGDGYADLLAKNGSSTKEGVWYISLNNKQGGYMRGYLVKFGDNHEYFIAPD